MIYSMDGLIMKLFAICPPTFHHHEQSKLNLNIADPMASINYLHRLSSEGGRGGLEPTSCHWVRGGGGHPGQVAKTSQGQHTETNRITYTNGQFSVPIRINWMSLNCGGTSTLRKPPQTQREHATSTQKGWSAGLNPQPFP